jgi:hypothetical protein
MFSLFYLYLCKCGWLGKEVFLFGIRHRSLNEVIVWLHLRNASGTPPVFSTKPIFKMIVTGTSKILSYIYGSVTNNNRFWIGRLDLLTPYKISSYLTGNTALSLIYTIYSSHLTRTRILSLPSSILVTELKRLTVTKSSNHTLSLHRVTSNSSSTTNFPWLSPTENWPFLQTLSLIKSRHGPRSTENAAPLLL